jgi:hypothetical protein
MWSVGLGQLIKEKNSGLWCKKYVKLRMFYILRAYGTGSIPFS